MTISQPEANEQEISLWVQVAIERLEKVDSDAKEKKTQIVKDLAKNLEGKIPTDRIANEIVHQLRGKVSERLIHSCLEKKYKEKYRVENAQKRKKKREVTAESAAPLLLEQEKPQQLMVAVTEEGKSVTIDETSKNREASISRTNESDSEKCPNCSELEEALRKATTLSTADTLYSTAEILDIEFSLHYQYVQQYMADEYRQGRDKVWFSVKIDVKNKEVTSAKVGRISESEANHDIN